MAYVQDGLWNHPEMVIGGVTIAEDSSLAANTSSTGGEEWMGVLLEDGAGTARVYAAITQADNENYAGENADYQIMVPVDSAAHTRSYYVFASLS